jgi:hypothetical protein
MVPDFASVSGTKPQLVLSRSRPVGLERSSLSHDPTLFYSDGRRGSATQ